MDPKTGARLRRLLDDVIGAYKEEAETVVSDRTTEAEDEALQHHVIAERIAKWRKRFDKIMGPPRVHLTLVGDRKCLKKRRPGRTNPWRWCSTTGRTRNTGTAPDGASSIGTTGSGSTSARYAAVCGGGASGTSAVEPSEKGT